MNAYGAWQVTAVLVASGITLVALNRGRLLEWRTGLVVFLATLGGLLGARFLKVAFHLSEARDNPALLWALDFRGLDMAGMILGVSIVGAGASLLLNLPIAPLANAAVPGLAAGMSLSKVGCWSAGCCFGKVYEGIGAVEVARFSDAHTAQVLADLVSPLGAPLPLFPVQTLEILIPIVAWGGSLVFMRGQGRGILVFLATYGVLKTMVTFLRFPDAAGDPPLVHLLLYLMPLGILVWVGAAGAQLPKNRRAALKVRSVPPIK